MLLLAFVHVKPELVGYNSRTSPLWAVHNVTTAGDVVSVPIVRNSCLLGRRNLVSMYSIGKGSEAIMTSWR